MRTTGIIRNLDSLGRITIPSEIRKEHGFKDDEPLEIISKAGGIFIKKVPTLSNLIDIIPDSINALCDMFRISIAVCDTQEIISSINVVRTIHGKRVHSAVMDKIKSCTTGDVIEFEHQFLVVASKSSSHIIPIIVSGESKGAIVLFKEDRIKTEHLIAARLIAKTLQNHLIQ